MLPITMNNRILELQKTKQIMTEISCQGTCTSDFILFIQLTYKSKFQPKACLNTEKCKYHFLNHYF